jgi:hypothetical protein
MLTPPNRGSAAKTDELAASVSASAEMGESMVKGCLRREGEEGERTDDGRERKQEQRIAEKEVDLLMDPIPCPHQHT